MPEVYDKDIKSASPKISADEQAIVSSLFELVETKNNPWKLDHNNILAECYNFKELRQWDGPDMQLLALSGVPTVPVDRIGRGFDTINGIRENTGNAVSIVTRKSGEKRIADILQKNVDYVTYVGGFDDVFDEQFDSMLSGGIGINKLGFDPTDGEGEIWMEFVATEDCGWSKCKKKELSDVRWIWQRQVMDWENAMNIEPSKASELKGMKVALMDKWNEIKSSNTKGSFAQDYSNLVVNQAEAAKVYPDQVEIWEFWLRHRIPLKKVGAIDFIETPQGVMPIPKIIHQPIDYQLGQGEQLLGTVVEEQWEQFIVASSGGKKNGILLKQSNSKYDFHPFSGECAERKKSGMPMGFVERCIPHQKRINIAWAQKTAYNNKSIKSPLVLRNAENIDDKIKQSQFGSILLLTGQEQIESINQQPQVDIQAIEEGNLARQDLDFAAASSEPTLRGEAGATKSGVQLSMQQSAAVTPLTRWVKAEKIAKLETYRKILKIILIEFPPERMAKIVGEELFMQLCLGIDPASGMQIEKPLPLPFNLSIEHYDVEIQNTSLSDFNRQQTFNAVEGLVSQGIPFTDDFRITNAPVKDVDAALLSNGKARGDIIKSLMMQVQQLTQQLDMTQKLIPTEAKVALGQAHGKIDKPNDQMANGRRGKAEPQNGQRSMPGGALALGGPSM